MPKWRRGSGTSYFLLPQLCSMPLDRVASRPVRRQMKSRRRAIGRSLSRRTAACSRRSNGALVLPTSIQSSPTPMTGNGRSRTGRPGTDQAFPQDRTPGASPKTNCARHRVSTSPDSHPEKARPFRSTWPRIGEPEMSTLPVMRFVPV